MPGSGARRDGEPQVDRVRAWNPVGVALKRLFDIGFVLLSLPVCLPLGALVAALIPLTSRGPAIYTARRVGRNGRVFRIFKFRTMVRDAAASGPGLTFRGDRRVTRIGRLLRRTKFDEFPQVLNVLAGQMSIVGPRPEAPEYVARYSAEQRIALQARPGLTSLAQVAHRDEEETLPSDDPERYYLQAIMPRKLELDVAYVREWTFWLDLRVFLVGLAALFRLHTMLGLDRIAGTDRAVETESESNRA